MMLLTGTVDVNVIGSLITSLGFPIVACGAMAFFIVKRSNANDEKIENMRKEQREDLIRIQSEHKAEVEKMQQEHKEEYVKFTTALENNTAAIERLTDRLEHDERS